MNLRTLSTGLSVGLAAIILAGCSFGPFGYIVEREEPTPTRAAPTDTPTGPPANLLPPGVTVSSVTPQLPPTQIVGASVGEGVASTAVVGPPLTSLPGGYPSATPPPTPEGNPTNTITVTLSDNNSTIRLRVGQTLLLYLNAPDGASMIWTVTIADETVVGRMKDVTLPEGAQGYFTGLKPGQTELMAVGDFPCRESTPPCMAPSMLFQVEIVVE